MSEHLAPPPAAPQPAGAAIDLEALRRQRSADGRFLPGLPGPRLTTGLRSRTLAELPDLAAAHAEKVQAIAADLGADLSTLQHAAVTEAARLTLIVDSLGDNLLRHGVLTGKGKTRAALSAYALALDRLHRLMTLLGVERRQKATQSLDDYLEGRTG